MDIELFSENGVFDAGGADWVDEDCAKRTRRKYPRSYDLHYKWREFDKNNPPEGLSYDYSDRLSEDDYEKYEAARQGMGWIEDITKEEAKTFVERYYDGKYECVGFAISAHLSTGYGIGRFMLLPKKAK